MTSSESCDCEGNKKLIQMSLHDGLPSVVFLTYGFYQEFPVGIIQSLLCHLIMVSEYSTECVLMYKNTQSYF